MHNTHRWTKRKINSISFLACSVSLQQRQHRAVSLLDGVPFPDEKLKLNTRRISTLFGKWMCISELFYHPMCLAWFFFVRHGQRSKQGTYSFEIIYISVPRAIFHLCLCVCCSKPSSNSNKMARERDEKKKWTATQKEREREICIYCTYVINTVVNYTYLYRIQV